MRQTEVSPLTQTHTPALIFQQWDRLLPHLNLAILTVHPQLPRPPQFNDLESKFVLCLPLLAGMYQMSVIEDKVPGEEVGRLKADDPDQGDNGLVNYRIVDGDGMGVFELSTDSETREAVVKLKKVTWGAEARSRYCLINCFNPSLEDLAI